MVKSTTLEKYINNFPRYSAYVTELSRGMIKRQYYGVFYKKTKIGKRLRLGTNVDFSLWGGGLSIGNLVFIRNFCRIQIEGGQLEIGSNTFFNNFCTINCLCKITIGKDCLFGEGVKIYDHNHNYSNNRQLIRKQGYCFGEVIIGNNCWIGSNVVILKGVSIGDNVIVGANCVVYKDIDSNSLVKIND